MLPIFHPLIQFLTCLVLYKIFSIQIDWLNDFVNQRRMEEIAEPFNQFASRGSSRKMLTMKSCCHNLPDLHRKTSQDIGFADGAMCQH